MLVLSQHDATERGARALQRVWQQFADQGEPPWLAPRARYWMWPGMGEIAARVWVHDRGFVLGYLNPDHWADGAQRLLNMAGAR